MAVLDMYGFIQQLWAPVIQQMMSSGIQLTALCNFYIAENGHAVMQKMPELSPMFAEMMRSILPQIQPKIQEIIKGS